jgi:aspartate/methionine/tyrosine aminotransferase
MIAKRLANSHSSHFRTAFALARSLPDPIDLSIGYPEDPTPEYIKAAGIAAITADQTRYTPSHGLPQLREAIAEKLRRDNNQTVTAANVTVTPGSTAGIMLTYLALLDPGDEILLPDPYFSPYFELASILDVVPIPVSTYPDFQITAARLEPHITPRTKAILINTPNNPTGAVYPEAELRRITELARRHDLIIIADEMYEYFTYDQPHFSLGSIYAKTITINGFSKGYSMTGWRIGYIAGPEEVIEAIGRLQQHTIFANSAIGERAALVALERRPEGLVDKYRHKRDLLRRQHTIAGTLHGSQGAFFAFSPVPAGMTDLEFSEQAARRGVIVLPSRAFSQRHDYVRIAFATADERLIKGLDILRSLWPAK